MLTDFDYLYDDFTSTIADLLTRSKYNFVNFDASQFRNSFLVVHLNTNKDVNKFDELRGHDT